MISIDEASVADNKVTVKFSASEDPDIEGPDVADIVPSVTVGMYGWDTIDSYIHAIHSGQAFDVGDIDFANAVEALHYEHHIEFPYPMLGSTNCESCHVEGAYTVPDQAQSLPGLLSASDKVKGMERKIGDVPVYVTGPASRACGGCHRAELINEDKLSEFISFQQHTKQGGYLIEGGEDADGTLRTIIDKVMAIFE